MDYIRAIEQQQIKEIPEFFPGSHVKVHYRIKEGNRERIQVFEGDVIRRHGSSNRETFTVRKVSFGVGVERTFPVHSPKIEKIEVVRHGAVRRAKLYYLRDKVGKAAVARKRASNRPHQTRTRRAPQGTYRGALFLYARACARRHRRRH